MQELRTNCAGSGPEYLHTNHKHVADAVEAEVAVRVDVTVDKRCDVAQFVGQLWRGRDVYPNQSCPSRGAVLALVERLSALWNNGLRHLLSWGAVAEPLERFQLA